MGECWKMFLLHNVLSLCIHSALIWQRENLDLWLPRVLWGFLSASLCLESENTLSLETFDLVFIRNERNGEKQF